MKTKEEIQVMLEYIIDKAYQKNLSHTAKELKKLYFDFGDWVYS